MTIAQAGSRKAVTSSQAVYRRSYVQPLREHFRRHAPDNADPRSASGVGKVQCEDHLFGLWESERLPVTILRVGHTLGPRSPAATRDPALFARIEAGRLATARGVAITAEDRLRPILARRSRTTGREDRASELAPADVAAIDAAGMRPDSIQKSIVAGPSPTRFG